MSIHTNHNIWGHRMARHGALADQLKALMAYRARPEGPIEPIKTNWTTVAANDNTAPGELADFGFERYLLVTPSVRQIMLEVDNGEVTTNASGQTVAIGNLRFSDGTQTEKAYTIGPDGDAIQYDARMPVGAMLGTTEANKQQSGGKGYTESEREQSNLYFAAMLNTIEPRFIPAGKRRNGPGYTSEQSRRILAEAYANTADLPPIKKFKAGLPCGGRKISESFIGMQKGSKGESGVMMWQDMCSSIVEREIWDETMARLKDEDKRTLDAAMTAKNTYAIGSISGYSGRSAWRNGKSALMAANDNLVSALRKSSA